MFKSSVESGTYDAAAVVQYFHTVYSVQGITQYCIQLLQYPLYSVLIPEGGGVCHILGDIRPCRRPPARCFQRTSLIKTNAAKKTIFARISINVYSLQQPLVIFQEKKAFIVAAL